MNEMSSHFRTTIAQSF